MILATLEKCPLHKKFNKFVVAGALLYAGSCALVFLLADSRWQGSLPPSINRPKVFFRDVKRLRTKNDSTMKANKQGSANADPVLQYDTLDGFECSENLLTLFTTVSSSALGTVVFNNTLRNWSQLQLDVRLILYVSAEAVDAAEDLSRQLPEPNRRWSVFPVPRYRTGLPVLRELFLHAMTVHETEFYGYANGDLLFTTTLLETLCYLREIIGDQKKVLITGRRINYDLANQETEHIDDFTDVEVRSAIGQLFIDQSEDFFISPSGGYPWSKVPEFVVGRVGFDNWLVADALLKRFAVVDVTDTVLCLHQSDPATGGSRSSWSANLSVAERDANKVSGLIAARFPISLGRITCAPFKTKWNVQRNAELFRRETLKRLCLREYKRLKINVEKQLHWLCPNCKVNTG